MRSARIVFRGGPIMLVSVEMDRLSRRTRQRRPVAGDFEQMHHLAAQGKAVIISESLAQLQHFRLWDAIEIPAPGAIVRLPVAGIVRDYSDQQGTIFIDRSVYLRYWNDASIDIFRVYLKPGAMIDDVRRRIQERFAGERRVFVLLNKDVRDYILRITDQWFGLVYVQLAVAVLIAVLGIVNTLTVSITDRKRELGILRAVGGLSSQIRGTIWMEAMAVALIGVLLGVAFGALDLKLTLEMAHRDFSGMAIDYRYPFGIAIALLPIMLGSALAGALGPGEKAVRGSLVEALEYE